MALPPYQFSLLVKLLLVRYSIACLRLFVVILHCLQRFYHKVDHWGNTITPISKCSLAFVSEIQKCLPEAVCCYITRFTLFTEILS